MSIFALVFSAVAGQPPHNPGQWVTSPDLPGMPIEITDSRDNDGQFCGRICNARADCYGFNYAPYGCTVDPGTKCNLNGGCCWLKASASSDKIITSVPNCAASFIMRPAAGSVNASEPAAVAPPVKPPRQLGAGVKNVLYILVDNLRPDVGEHRSICTSYEYLLQNSSQMILQSFHFSPFFHHSSTLQRPTARISC